MLCECPTIPEDGGTTLPACCPKWLLNSSFCSLGGKKKSASSFLVSLALEASGSPDPHTPCDVTCKCNKSTSWDKQKSFCLSITCFCIGMFRFCAILGVMEMQRRRQKITFYFSESLSVLKHYRNVGFNPNMQTLHPTYVIYLISKVVCLCV